MVHCQNGPHSGPYVSNEAYSQARGVKSEKSYSFNGDENMMLRVLGGISMPKWKWTERTFTFDFPVAKYPDLLERWRGTPVRIAAMVAGLPRDLLTGSDGRGWSIMQNIGHLVDLGYLPRRRIEQILAGETTLIAADMSNQATNRADHNARDASEVIAELRTDREDMVARLEQLSEADWGKSALHPRIQQPMRIVDIIYFDSEHDDYHIARIRELIRNL